MARAQAFFWYELMTEDVEASLAFYEAVVGWTSSPFANPTMTDPYVVLNAGESGVAGMMKTPQEVSAMGVHTAWRGYVHSEDTDATVERVRAAGGRVFREPGEIPQIGRFAVVSDPQGAVFLVMKPYGPDQPTPAPMTPGRIGWRELYTSDLDAAVRFYGDELGWAKGDGMDMGEMGVYQLIASDGGDPDVGMMTRPSHIPASFWMFYFNVTGIDDAVRRVTDNGGRVLFGPADVPGGAWIIQCMDPQGATFGLLAPGR